MYVKYIIAIYTIFNYLAYRYTVVIWSSQAAMNVDR